MGEGNIQEREQNSWRERERAGSSIVLAGQTLKFKGYNVGKSISNFDMTALLM